MPVHHLTCNLCEAMCGINVTAFEGRITDLRGDSDDPFSRGHICPKGPALRELYEDVDRLRKPMRRSAGGWQEVSWESAIDEAATRLGALQNKHGRDAVGVYFGNPTVHNHGATLIGPAFLRALGTKNRFDANSQDANPKLFVCMTMFGDQLSITIPDVDRTDFMLILGANPAASNGSLMTLGDVRGRLHAIRERGGRIVLIDPRRTETAAWCDEHHFIRPGGDAALLLALHNVLFTERLIDESAVSAVARSLDALKAIAAPFTPERVASSVGIEANAIRTLARAFARAPRAVAYGRVGTCQNEFSSVASWLTESLNVITGNFDRPGGMMFTNPAVDVSALGRKLIGNHYGRWRSRVRGLPEFAGQLPAAVMAEEMETAGPGQIRGFITFAGNPVLSTPNGERLAAALKQLDFMVAVDIYINETTRHAHLILPPLHLFERSHYDVVFNALAVRNTAKFSPPVFPKPPGAKSDWEILYELGMRLGGLRFGNKLIDRLAKLAWRVGLKLSADQVLDIALRIGPHGDHYRPGSSGLSLKRLAESPHGIDLGPLTPSRASKVRTPDGRVDLAPEILRGEIARVSRWIEDRGRASLVLIGRRHVRTNNSWMHNCRSLIKGPDRSSLLINPVDATRLGLSDGQRVTLQSRVGAIPVSVEPSADVMPGVVSLPHGYGHAGVADTLHTAGAVPGANINALTDELLLDPLTGTAHLNGLAVTLEV